MREKPDSIRVLYATHFFARGFVATRVDARELRLTLRRTQRASGDFDRGVYVPLSGVSVFSIALV
jgi:hypothetical protein